MNIELQTLKLTTSLLFMSFDSASYDRAFIVRSQISALRLLLAPGAPAEFVQVLDAAHHRADARMSELSGEHSPAVAVGG